MRTCLRCWAGWRRWPAARSRFRSSGRTGLYGERLGPNVGHDVALALCQKSAQKHTQMAIRFALSNVLPGGIHARSLRVAIITLGRRGRTPQFLRGHKGISTGLLDSITADAAKHTARTRAMSILAVAVVESFSNAPSSRFAPLGSLATLCLCDGPPERRLGAVGCASSLRAQILGPPRASVDYSHGCPLMIRF